MLKRGFVLVGAVSTTDGTINSIKAGPLLFLDRKGNLVAPSPYTTMLDGPWDLTIVDQGGRAKVFVSNVLNGTVTRLDLVVGDTSVTVAHATVIATGYTVAPNGPALILGPTGLAYDPQSDSLFVASTADNAIFRVAQAGTRTGAAGPGTVVFQKGQLRGPLALAFALNGHLIAANGDAVNDDPTQPSELVEFTLGGQFVAQTNVDPAEGGAFGFAIGNVSGGIARFVAVDDNTASITVNDLSQQNENQNADGRRPHD